MFVPPKFLMLVGMLALFARGEVTSEMAQLRCDVFPQTDKTCLYRVKIPHNSQGSKSSWEKADGTKIAQHAQHDPTLVKHLTPDSITTNYCMDYLRFLYREEWNGTDDEERWSEAICEVNCSALMTPPTPPLAINNCTKCNDSSSSKQISAQTRQRARWISMGVSAFFLLLLFSILGIGLWKRQNNNKEKERRTGQEEHGREELRMSLIDIPDTSCNAETSAQVPFSRG